VIEEARFFVRIGLIAVVLSIVYWFVSYEVAGTILLAFVGIGVLLFVGPVGRRVGLRRGKPPGGERSPVRRAMSAADRVIGFNEHHDLGDDGPLAVAEEALPTSSIWPPAAAFTATIVALGLLYGGWFWMPGAALAVVVTAGWVRQLED
jgi:hypothetical protein